MPPIGWFLAQGMIPLGEDSSDDDEGPAELPDGRLVCGPHGLVVCYRCAVDYSFTDEVLRENRSTRGGREAAPRPSGSQYIYSIFSHAVPDDEALSDTEIPPLTTAPQPSGSEYIYSVFSHAVSPDEAPSDTEIPPVNIAPSARVTGHDRCPKRGSGRVFPDRFEPPSTSVAPQELFSGRRNFMQVTRFTHRDDSRTGLIYTDGACADNGQANPKAGWAFWHGLSPSRTNLLVSGRLEKKGPFGDEGAQTSNRAELRAVIAALRFRYWPGENFHKLVIATDSEYVVEGATNWGHKWAREGWTRRVAPRSQERTEVKNKDLWLALLGEVEKYKNDGMEVLFWRIPREWNIVADAAAKEAATGDRDVPDEWRDVLGVNIGFNSG